MYVVSGNIMMNHVMQDRNDREMSFTCKQKAKKGIQTEPPSYWLESTHFLESHTYRQNKTTNFLVTIFSQHSMVFNEFSFGAESDNTSQLWMKVN